MSPRAARAPATEVSAANVAAVLTTKVSEASVPNVLSAVATTGACNTMFPVLETRMSPPVPEALVSSRCRLERSAPEEAVPAATVTCPAWEGGVVPELSPATKSRLPAVRVACCVHTV